MINVTPPCKRCLTRDLDADWGLVFEGHHRNLSDTSRMTLFAARLLDRVNGVCDGNPAIDRAMKNPDRLIDSSRSIEP